MCFLVSQRMTSKIPIQSVSYGFLSSSFFAAQRYHNKYLKFISSGLQGTFGFLLLLMSFNQNPTLKEARQLEFGETSMSTKRRTTGISDGEGNSKSYQFPHDILMIIATGLPVKSLVRFLCVSKQWESSIRSKRFMDGYLTNSLSRPEMQGLLLTFTCEDKCFVFSSPRLENADEASSSSLATYNMTYTMRARAAIAPSVHGLFCYGPASGLVIYNPCTRRSIVLPGISSRSKKIINHYVGYAVDSGYKVVLCVMSGKPRIGDERALVEEIWVLTLGNEQSWRMVKDIPPHSPTCDEMCIDGVLYYGAFTGANLTEPAIMSFDVRSERFDLIKGPEYAGEFLSSSKLTSYEGKIAVLFFEDQAVGTIVLWVLEDAANEEWSNKAFDLPSLVGWTTDLELRLFGATNAGEVILAPRFVRASTFRVVYYDPKKGNLRKIEIEGITEREVPDEVKKWWYCYPVSVFPGQVENLMFV